MTEGVRGPSGEGLHQRLVGATRLMVEWPMVPLQIRPCYTRITESQNGRGWKRLLWV